MTSTTFTPLIGLLAVSLATSALAQQQPVPFQSGGLAPPAPMEPPASTTYGSTSTEQRLTQAEHEDSGRGLEWLYVEGSVGLSHMSLETFSSDGLIYGSVVPSSGTGPSIGGRAGIRLLLFTAGLNARYHSFENWNLVTIDGEVGLHLPMGAWEPYLSLAGGYAKLGSLREESWGGSVDIGGFNTRLTAGLSYYVTPVFTVGATLSGEALALSRSKTALAASATPSLDKSARAVAEQDGSSVGGVVSASAVLGLHF